MLQILTAAFLWSPLGCAPDIKDIVQTSPTCVTFRYRHPVSRRWRKASADLTPTSTFIGGEVWTLRL